MRTCRAGNKLTRNLRISCHQRSRSYRRLHKPVAEHVAGFVLASALRQGQRLSLHVPPVFHPAYGQYNAS